MGIIDFEHASFVAENRFFDNPKISFENKKAMRRFLAQYNVKPATKNKFFHHIKFLLESLKDVEVQMHDRELINLTFKNFRENLSPGYVGTLINVSKAFVRWLNDGELPKGFKDVKSISKNEGRRSLHPEDMWSWEDGESVAKVCPSIQMKAIVLTQLDAGFRPSEFVDLNYGDVAIDKNDTVLFTVREGKTGFRIVPCYRCAPAFLRWFHSHPTKKKTDPLWIMEYTFKSNGKNKLNDSEVVRYNYYALQKRFQDLSRRAGIKKPLDFYNLRHSSCTLDKIDNVPLEVASGRHGHSVEYFTQVYGRLDPSAIANRLRSHYGGVEEKKKLQKNIVCSRCEFVNESSSEICFKCNAPLTVKKAMELEKIKSEEALNLKLQQEKMDFVIKSLQKKGLLPNKI